MSDIVKKIDSINTREIAKVNVNISTFQVAAEKLQEQADRAEISDADSYATGGDLIKVSNSHKKKAEDRRKEITKPLNDLVKFLNGEFKPVTAAFDKVRSTIEKKMIVWQRQEEKRLAAEAEAERKRIEEEALERAAQESTDEAQEEVLESAAEAGAKVVEESGVGLKRGMYGSTGTRKSYETVVVDSKKFLSTIIDLSKDDEYLIGELIEFRKGGLNKLAKRMVEKNCNELPGAKFKEVKNVRVY